MKKKFLVSALVMTLLATNLLGNQFIVHAEENDAGSELDVEFVDSLDGIEDEALQTVFAADLLHENKLQQDNNLTVSVSEQDCIGEFSSNMISTYSSANSITQSFSGTIDTEGGLSYLLVTLAPGDILQATLAGPNNADINYDLLLYTYNDGLDTYVTGSTLSTYINSYDSTTKKSVEDAISYINTGDSSQTYALIVYATEGCSSTATFTLTVSIDEEGYYDASEPNDNPFTAVTVSTGVKITGCNLNVSNDQDWFVWNVPSTISGVSLSLSNTLYTAEMYYASGTSMVLVKPDSNKIYKLNPGYYYIRVYNKKSEGFTSTDYTLTMQPYGKTVSTLKVTFDGDMGTAKATYTEGSYHRFQRKLTPSVMVLDASGYPVVSQEVTLTWLQEDDPMGLKEPYSITTPAETTDSNGKVSFNLTTPEALGYHYCYLPGVMSFAHYYDIDGIVFICGGKSSGQIVYHFEWSEYMG